MADIKGAAERSKNMAAIRSRDTKPEIFIRKRLFADGFRYRIAPKNIPGHPDLYLKKYNVAVFINGCFWHRHFGCKYAYKPKSRKEFWEKKFESNICRDREVRNLLSEQGIREIIIWECVIKRSQKRDGNVDGLFEQIEDAIRSDIPFWEVGESESIKTWWDNPDCARV